MKPDKSSSEFAGKHPYWDRNTERFDHDLWFEIVWRDGEGWYANERLMGADSWVLLGPFATSADAYTEARNHAILAQRPGSARPR